MISRKRSIQIVIAIVLLATIGSIAYNIYLLFERAGKIAVTLVTAPTDATTTFTNTATKKVTKGNSGTVYIEPGVYDISVEKKDFSSYKKTQDIAKNNTIIAELSPRTKEAADWVDKHRDQYTKLETFAGKKSLEYNKSVTDKYPLIGILPLKDPYYSIGHYKKENGEPVVVITTESPQYRYAATRRITSMGYKLSDYRIEYKDFQNPLKEKK
jgi:hypothetical protein cdiviTM7_00537